VVQKEGSASGLAPKKNTGKIKIGPTYRELLSGVKRETGGTAPLLENRSVLADVVAEDKGHARGEHVDSA